MKACPRCNHRTDDADDRYCSRCGSALEPARVLTAEHGTAMKPARKKYSLALLIVGFNAALIGGTFMFGSKGCSKTEGSFVSAGRPVGDFTIVPKKCRSGQRMNFFGAVLLGEGPDDGAVVAIIDPVRGKLVKVEVPGSCRPPDREVCREVLIEPSMCSKFDVSVTRTSTEVNDIRLIDGHISLDCTFPEDGSVRANLKFENCD